MRKSSLSNRQINKLKTHGAASAWTAVSSAPSHRAERGSQTRSRHGAHKLKVTQLSRYELGDDEIDHAAGDHNDLAHRCVTQ